MKITRKELIKKYIDFFKRLGHKEIPNASLIPENDPTVLFTTSGMHPLVPYLLGEKHPLGKRLCNVQRCIRTQDIDGVGNTTHHTFFEMLGNWSLGDYFKEDAIKYSFQFLTSVLKIPVERIAVSCFKGDKDAPKDLESFNVWKSLGISEDRIIFLGKEDNWWGPVGNTGPCGPDSEMFYWKSNKISPPKVFRPEDSNWVEIGNDVLMEYLKTDEGYKIAEQKNVDFGGGVERMITVLNNLEDSYLTPHFYPVIKRIEDISKKDYSGNEKPMRIIADHIRASVFLIADGVIPSNTEQGYVLRRLIRRSLRYGRVLGIKDFTARIAESLFNIYDDYNHLIKNKRKIIEELSNEEARFLETLEKGIKIFEEIIKKSKSSISGKDAFLLYQSYGFPFEMTLELAKEKNMKVDDKEFKKEFESHQRLSRTSTQGKFKSGLADNSESTTRLHTATHLLNQALREVLKRKDISQKGSNITPERLRFDFNFERKLTDEEIKKIEKLVNDKIKENLHVNVEEMSVDKARECGAQGVFDGKYSDRVKVYSIGEKGREFSKEICAGPHVSSIDELGTFKIMKEESSSAGVRRIKAVLE